MSSARQEPLNMQNKIRLLEKKKKFSKSFFFTLLKTKKKKQNLRNNEIYSIILKEFNKGRKKRVEDISSRRFSRGKWF